MITFLYANFSACKSYLKLQINELGCYEAKIEESEKAGSRRELNPGHLWLEPPVFCHLATISGQPPTLTILYMYYTGGTECPSRTPGSHSACAVRTPLGVDRKIHIEDCEGWWLSCCRGSAAEHWRLKPEVSRVRLPVAAGLLHFPLFSPHNI